MTDVYDCVVIGGGPAGLMAAIYLARFRRSVILFDAGAGRASVIPKSHNIPGFVDGMSGKDLLDRMTQQVRLLDVSIRNEKVVSLMKADGTFQVASDQATVEAPTVVLATGIVDRSAVFEGWREALADNLLGFCPVCDAFEARHKRIAVVGPRPGSQARLFSCAPIPAACRSSFAARRTMNWERRCRALA